MLTEQKKKYFKKSLTQRLNQLLAEGNNNANGAEALNERLPDPSDRATAESERDFTLRIREIENGRIDQIKEALDRIEDGTYGICEECEEEIPEKRLRAMPTATLCIECKKREETEEKIRAF